MGTWTEASAVAIAQAIRRKEISSVEIVRAFLERIGEVDAQLNAVVQLAADRALDAAQAADAALAAGEIRGPLHGVPITIKDSFDTAGIVSTGGTTGRAHFVPDEDATVVARLRAAGAILLGKTNTPELTLAPETDNLIYGRTNNPYDVARSPSGSSGGAAAILAASGSPLDLGSDTWGSIRVPAHVCGIVGIKPTSGRIPRTGHIIPFGGPADAITTFGPMSRFVEDLHPVLELLCGPDGRDPYVVPVPLRDPSDVALDRLRVAFYVDNGLLTPLEDVRRVVREVATSLSEVVAAVEERRPPGIEAIWDLMTGLGTADGGAWVRRLLAAAGTTEIHPWIEPLTRDIEPISTAAFGELIGRCDRFRSEMLRFLDDFDVLVSPVEAYPAQRHRAVAEGDQPYMTYTMLHNLTGWPSVVVRGGTSAEGLPIGVQIVAGPWREDIALAVAAHVEAAFGGWKPPQQGGGREPVL